MPLMTETSMQVSGRDLGTGLPETVTVTSTQVEEAMQRIYKQNNRYSKTNFRANSTRVGIRYNGKGDCISRRRSTN